MHVILVYCIFIAHYAILYTYESIQNLRNKIFEAFNISSEPA